MEVTFSGETMRLEGNQPKVGEPAPHFSLKDLNGNTVNSEDLKGEVVILSVFPDITTSVCDQQTRSFNEKASGLEGIRLVSVTKNTADELKDWCAAKGLELEMLPDAEGTFGRTYGLNMIEMDKLARSVFVITQEGLIGYREILPEGTNEPNYDAAVEAAKDLV